MITKQTQDRDGKMHAMIKEGYRKLYKMIKDRDDAIYNRAEINDEIRNMMEK
jgi:ribosomal protein S6